ncbi:hypothetical protein B0H13DRAFT_2065833 [Mycena leptocephala]|nr:hypothetical protein B0H13DRAFT_2065833 [Mycena leptocephala]
MIALAGQKKLRKHVCSEIQVGLRGARGDDTSSIKGCISDYAALSVPAPVLVVSDTDAEIPAPPPPPVEKFSPRSKVDRGYNHPHSARLNTPVKYPATEAYDLCLIRNGEIVVVGTDMPYLMYRDGHVYNKDDMEDGLLEGTTLFAHIYQGPSTALKEDGYTRGRAGNAALNGVTALTARDIAYVAVQTRFALSSQENWTPMDVRFSYPDFYWSVVDLLDSEEGQEIIDRFNIKVFGTKSSTKSTATSSAGPSDFQLLEAQRAAKRARKIADAAGTAAA